MNERPGRDRRRSDRSEPEAHDAPYVFGALPTTDRPHPFSLMQYARLLLLRGRLKDGALAEEREGRYHITQHHGIVWVERAGATYFRRPEFN